MERSNCVESVCDDTNTPLIRDDSLPSDANCDTKDVRIDMESKAGESVDLLGEMSSNRVELQEIAKNLLDSDKKVETSSGCNYENGKPAKLQRQKNRGMQDRMIRSLSNSPARRTPRKKHRIKHPLTKNPPSSFDSIDYPDKKLSERLPLSKKNSESLHENSCPRETDLLMSESGQTLQTQDTESQDSEVLELKTFSVVSPFFDVCEEYSSSYASDSTEDESNEEIQLEVSSCRAPIASLDCMEEFQGCGDHVSTRGDCQAVVSRQNSNAVASLKYKPLGKSGLRVSQLGLGAWVTFSPIVPDETAEAIVSAAYDAGLNFFDLSEAYSNGRAEITLGNLLKKKTWRRCSYHVMTKVYWNSKGEERGLSRKHIIESVKSSVKRLQLDYVDVLIIHRADDMCPMEEVVRAMSFCLAQGLIMYWGTARWSPVEIMEAWTNCRQFNCATPIVEQSEYHMFCRGKTELYLPEMYNKIGVGTMAWSPLTLGLISERMDNGVPVFTRQSSKKKYSSSQSWIEDESSGNTKEQQGYTWLKDKSINGEDARRHQTRLRELGALAEKLGCTISQLSVAWTLKNDNLHCALVGGTSVNQLLENIAALQIVPKLTTDVLLELERILDNKPMRPQRISTLAQR